MAQAVQPSDCRRGVFDGRHDISLSAEIQFKNPAGRSASPTRGIFQSFPITTDDHEPCALSAKMNGYCTPDAGRCAGHHDGLTLKGLPAFTTHADTCVQLSSSTESSIALGSKSTSADPQDNPTP